MVLTMYKHLTREQRYVISALLAKGFSLTDIANETQVAYDQETADGEERIRTGTECKMDALSL